MGEAPRLHIVDMRAGKQGINIDNVVGHHGGDAVPVLVFIVLLLFLLASDNQAVTVVHNVFDDRYNVTDNQRRHSIMPQTRFLTNTDKELRIINGYSTDPYRFPYAASLQLNEQHYCGGALVAPDLVVTAAHCAELTPIITLGRYDLDDPLDTDYEEMNILSAIVHPQYDKVVVDNDVALLVLQKQSIHPYVRINDNPNVPDDGEELTVMGWGDINGDPSVKETSDELRETQVWYLPNSKCEQSKGTVETSSGYQEASYNGQLTDSMMCALDKIGNISDACQGDSGGVLVRTGTASTGEDDLLLGLVSWGYGCANPDFPGVYSRMSSLFPWLRESICSHSQSAPAYLVCNYSSTPQPSSGVLTFLIKTDRTPEDTGWELRSVPVNEIVTSRPMGYYNEQEQEVIETEVVETESFYKLIIYDRGRDGFQGILAVFRGESIVKSDLLVFEPGFTSKSQDSVTHGFYVGDDPPKVLTLDIKFDSNPEQLAWILTNKDDNLELGFRWFGFYTEGSASIRETIPIYGSERGQQEYNLLIFDSSGDGLCCAAGFGSYSLYLGQSVDSSNIITSGAQYLTEQSYTFQISSSGALVPSSGTSPSALATNPHPSPTSGGRSRCGGSLYVEPITTGIPYVLLIAMILL